MKKIIFIIKGSLDKAVPIISVAQALNAAGNNVEIICGNISGGLKNDLEKDGVKIDSLSILEKNNNFLKYILKIYYWILFRKRALKILQNQSFDILYIATGDTAIVLRGAYSQYKYFLHLRELYDKHPIYMKLLKKPAQKAFRVIVPEENRAFLYYYFLNLKKIPLVIPNKPFYHPQKRKMDIGFLDPEIQKRIKTKKNIIYQGLLLKERNLTNLIKASLSLKDFNIILMGEDFGMLSRYKSINKNIIYIPFVRPPLHLNVTSWADIGIITYDLHSLNTIYCAPNKLWEFSGFSIPILGNHNLGIKNIISKYNAGEIVNFENINDILKGLNNLNSDYDKYLINSKKLYNSYDGHELFKLIN